MNHKQERVSQARKSVANDAAKSKTDRRQRTKRLQSGIETEPPRGGSANVGELSRANRAQATPNIVHRIPLQTGNEVAISVAHCNATPMKCRPNNQHEPSKHESNQQMRNFCFVVRFVRQQVSRLASTTDDESVSAVITGAAREAALERMDASAAMATVK
jgi:hypothetical protein